MEPKRWQGISEASRKRLGKGPPSLVLAETERGSVTSQRLELEEEGEPQARAVLLHLKTGIFLKIGS